MFCPALLRIWYYPANDPAWHPRMTLGVPNMEVRESLKSLWWKQLMKIEEEDFSLLLCRCDHQREESHFKVLCVFGRASRSLLRHACA